LYFLKIGIIQIGGSANLLWILAGIGLLALWLNKKVRQRSLFMTGFLLFSFLAICPGLYFRPHYFILLLPALALLVGIWAGSVRDVFAGGRTALLTRVVPILLFLAVLFHATYQQWNYFFVMSPSRVTRTTYGSNPFLESLEIARFIKERSTKDDRVAVVGSEPQIYFYSNRRSATGYIYTYPLMGNHNYALKMQEEMIREIEMSRPEFLVFVNVDTSWMNRPDSGRLIFQWFKQYQQKYYRQVGVIDIISHDQTIYRWGRDSIGYLPLSEHWLTVFQRKS